MLASVTDSVDMGLSKLQKTEDGGAWRAAVRVVEKSLM